MAKVREIAQALGDVMGAADPPIRYETFLPDTFTPPICLVATKGVQYHTSFANRIGLHRFDIIVLVARSSDRAALELAEDFMDNDGDTSLRKLLEKDQTLAGVVESVLVRESEGPTSLSINGAEYVSVLFATELHAG